MNAQLIFPLAPATMSLIATLLAGCSGDNHARVEVPMMVIGIANLSASETPERLPSAVIGLSLPFDQAECDARVVPRLSLQQADLSAEPVPVNPENGNKKSDDLAAHVKAAMGKWPAIEDLRRDTEAGLKAVVLKAPLSSGSAGSTADLQLLAEAARQKSPQALFWVGREEDPRYPALKKLAAEMGLPALTVVPAPVLGDAAVPLVRQALGKQVCKVVKDNALQGKGFGVVLFNLSDGGAARPVPPVPTHEARKSPAPRHVTLAASAPAQPVAAALHPPVHASASRVRMPNPTDHADAQCSTAAQDSPFGLKVQADEAFRRGDQDLALSLYGRALASQPDDVEALLDRSTLLLRQGKVVEAELDLAHAALLAPSNAAVQYNLAVALTRAGDFNRALEALGRALDWGFDPWHASRDPDLGMLEQQRGPRIAQLLALHGVDAEAARRQPHP